MYLNNAAMGDSEVMENCRQGLDFGVALHPVHHAGSPEPRAGVEPDEQCERIHEFECNTVTHGMPTIDLAFRQA